MIERPKWDGRAVVCIASGPSLTAEDCELVRASGHPAVVTNTTFQLCLWADAVYAHDAKWWKRYHEEVKATFKGRRFGSSMLCENYGANPSIGLSWFRQFSNSGVCAISLALGGQAGKIILVGYDAAPGPAGEMHWHGAHPKELSNAESMGRWGRQFELIAKEAAARDVPVVNASRRTALKCFARGELECVL
ncbi:MAG: hypothetical protein V4669_13685 [Pseudomonadota bacterium]